MTFSQFFAILKARRLSALLLLSALVLGVAGWSWLQPRQYVATAAVMVDARLADPVAAPGAGGYGSSSSYMATQIDLIQSERVALRALRALHLSDDAGWRRAWRDATGGKGEYEPWLADQLLRKLDVKPSRESSVVNIGYVSSDPAFSAAMANAFVRAYIDTTLDMKVEPAKQYNAFFDERAKQLRGALEQAQNRLSAFQQSKGLVGVTDERLDVENARLSELSSQVVMLQGKAAESSSRQVQAGADSQEVLSNQMIGNITADLARQEAKLSELKQRLGENNPQLVDQNANVEQLRQRLAFETRRIASSLGLNSNADRSRLGAAQAALEAQRARVLSVRGQRDEASVLQRDIDNAQKAYEGALSRVTQTHLESQNTFTNVAILKTASPPTAATSPRVLLNTAVALVIGSLLAAGYALVREFSDRRLRFESDVTQLLRQPLLARLPHGDSDSRTGFQLKLPNQRSSTANVIQRVAS